MQIFATFLLVAAVPLAAHAQQDLKVGFVSTERIFRDAAPAKAATAKLEQEFSKREKDLQELAAKLKSAAEKLDKEIPAGFPDSGWVPAYEAWAKRNGLWVPARTAELDDGRVGDLAVFWFEAKQRCAHIGIVVGCPSAGIWTTVEGNTGPDTATSVNRDGDGVYQKRRTRAMLGSRGGFVRINF